MRISLPSSARFDTPSRGTTAAQAHHAEMTNFLTVLLFAVIFLIPEQDPLGLGLPLVGIGLFGLYVCYVVLLGVAGSVHLGS